MGEALCLPAGHEEPLHELRPLLRDRPGLRALLHARHGQGPEDVPLEDQLVAARHPLLRLDLVLRRDEEVPPPKKPRRVDRAGDLLLSFQLNFSFLSFRVLTSDYYETSCYKAICTSSSGV